MLREHYKYKHKSSLHLAGEKASFTELMQGALARHFPMAAMSALLHHTSPLLSLLLIVFCNRLLHASECLVVPTA